MSYEVTATRRRPQQFDNLVGQEFVAQTLKNSIKSGKIAHAYLFAGPRGCGKTSTARILAKALNCKNGPTDCPCGQCSNCQEITKGTSLDVIEIDGASNNSVDNIRQIKDEVLFPPSNSKYKIYIIDEVHMLSTPAFNALLKTIEEPPPYVVFIFATTELQKVPATIKSRCQQYNFRLVAIEKVKQCLAEAAAELNVQADDEALFWIARESTGSMRDAYTLFDQVVAFSDGHITYEKIRDKLGLVGVDRLNMIFEACILSKTDQVINLIDEFLQSGISIEQMISNTADYLRSLLLIKNGIKNESLLGNSFERYSPQVIAAWNPLQIERALSIFLQLYRDIRYSLSPRYELELSFSRLCWIGQYVSNMEVKKAIEAARCLLSGAASQSLPPSQNDGRRAVPVNSPYTENTEQKKTSEIHIPNGLPRLSMLDNPPPEDSEDGENEGESSNPFYDGGSLPPEQKVGPEVKEQLTIHIPEAELSLQKNSNTVFVPESETGYSYNPDEESEEGSDNWSNMDEPPDAQVYADSENFYDDIAENFEEGGGKVNESATPQLNESFTTADGKVLSVAQLRGSVMAALSVTDGFAASNLEKTGLWKVLENEVITNVFNAYDLELIKKKIPVIESEISTVCGKKMQFNVTLQEEKKEADKKPVKLPVQVELLVDTFKGTVVAGKM